jgi:hypothetical protein
MRIGKHPLEGSCQEAILFPTQLLITSFRCVPLGQLHPRLGLQTHPCFLAHGVGCSGAAPNTHQAQGSLTSRLPAKRLPLALVVPQKTVGSLPCPIGYCAQMPWLPCGSRFHLAHGRGVARLHHSEGGHLSWVEVGTNQMVWFPTIFPTRLPPQPNHKLGLSQKLCGHQKAPGRA